MKRTEDNLGDFWDNIQSANIHVIGVPEGEERDKGAENIFEDIITENFPNLNRLNVTQVQEAQRVPYRMSPKRNMPRHTVIKMTKIGLPWWRSG